MVALLSAVIAAVLGLLATAEAQKGASPNQSDVVSLAKATREDFEWGSFFTYHTGQTDATEGVLTGVAEINPGQQIHPPHQHAEEEYLMVLEGSGEWHLKGREFPAAKGDMLYAAPWDLHGIRNTGSVPLKFVVWKYAVKDVPAPPRPAQGDH